MKTILWCFLLSLSTFIGHAANPGIIFNSTTRNTSPTNLNYKASSLLLGGATPSRLAWLDPNLMVTNYFSATLAISDGGTAASSASAALSNLGGVAESRTITGIDSLSGGGDLTANRTLSLLNDEATPGNSEYYGTDGAGVKGFFPLPTGAGSFNPNQFDTSGDATIKSGALVTNLVLNLRTTNNGASIYTMTPVTNSTFTISFAKQVHQLVLTNDSTFTFTDLGGANTYSEILVRVYTTGNTNTFTTGDTITVHPGPSLEDPVDGLNLYFFSYDGVKVDAWQDPGPIPVEIQVELTALQNDKVDETSGTSTDQILITPQIQSGIILGVLTYPDNVTQVFNPGNANAGINFGQNPTDPSAGGNADAVYNNTLHKYRVWENGAITSILTELGINTSAELLAIVGDETGTGLLVFGTSPLLTTPQIGDFSNANHDHQDAAGGGTLDASAIASGTIATARLGSGTANSTTFLRGDGAWEPPPGGSSPTTTQGDVIVRGAAVDERLAIGRVDQALTVASGGVSLTYKNPAAVDEFLSAVTASSFNWAIAGSVSAGVASPEPGHLGCFALNTLATTNGIGLLRVANAIGAFSTNIWSYTVRVRSPAALSTDADVYHLWIGFGDSTAGADPVDGAYFEYQHTLSANWLGKTSNNSTRTTASGGSDVAVVANTWYDLRMEGNSSSVTFYVSSDGGYTWTNIGTSSTNIPSTSGREFGLQVIISKEAGSVGTTSRSLYLDRFMLQL